MGLGNNPEVYDRIRFQYELISSHTSMDCFGITVYFRCPYGCAGTGRNRRGCSCQGGKSHVCRGDGGEEKKKEEPEEEKKEEEPEDEEAEEEEEDD